MASVHDFVVALGVHPFGLASVKVGHSLEKMFFLIARCRSPGSPRWWHVVFGCRGFFLSLVSVATLSSHILPKGSSRRLRANGRALAFLFLVMSLILIWVALGPYSAQVSPSSQVIHLAMIKCSIYPFRQHRLCIWL